MVLENWPNSYFSQKPRGVPNGTNVFKSGPLTKTTIYTVFRGRLRRRNQTKRNLPLAFQFVWGPQKTMKIDICAVRKRGAVLFAIFRPRVDRSLSRKGSQIPGCAQMFPAPAQVVFSCVVHKYIVLQLCLLLKAVWKTSNANKLEGKWEVRTTKNNANRYFCRT